MQSIQESRACKKVLVIPYKIKAELALILLVDFKLNLHD